MAIITVNVVDLYKTLSTKSNQTGFIAHPMTLADGRKIAGLYRGFGSNGIAVQNTPKDGQKGFRSLNPIESDINNNLRIQD